MNTAIIKKVKTSFNGRHRIEGLCYFKEISAYCVDSHVEHGHGYYPTVMATLRFYSVKSGRVYACLWLSSGDSGSGYASGYGYCKWSAAAQAAISSCGIELLKSIDGVGMDAVNEALRAIVISLGGKRVAVTTHHP